ncbi:hypothetical protein KS4_05280 [Poriferisphaera corsica]|uniref:Uncharacterized protein n=1 Tax=Poriferisphaera corsica TaxID=2528020 RepID=A0A517YQJ3_9BACT|nr:hypothetical protein KS4_05280 [Poriferisphaera corsica]
MLYRIDDQLNMLQTSIRAEKINRPLHNYHIFEYLKSESNMTNGNHELMSAS